MTTREQYALEAQSCVKTKWKHQGRKKGIGLDCIGLIGWVGVSQGNREALLWAADRTLHSYGREPQPSMLFAACDKYLDPAEGEIQLADIFVMRAEKDFEPRHFAIVSRLNPVYIVHAYMQARRVVENIYDPDARARTHARYCFRGLT